MALLLAAVGTSLIAVVMAWTVAARRAGAPFVAAPPVPTVSPLAPARVWTNIVHRSGAASIQSASEVDAAVSDGLSLDLLWYNTPTSRVTQEMRRKGMTYIDNYPWMQIYYACQAAYATEATCRITPSQEALIEDRVRTHLIAVRRDPAIVGYWILDDWPHGDVLTTLVEIHKLIAQANAAAIVPRPTLCGFGGRLDYKDVSTDPTFHQDHAYFDRALVNFSPLACDLVVPYPYGVSAWDDPRAIDWSMSTLLPYMKQALAARGWDAAREPMVGMPQTFGQTRPPHIAHDAAIPHFIAPTGPNIATQTAAYCRGGASTIIAYTWRDDTASATSVSLSNNLDMRHGYETGIRLCQGYWGNKQTG